MAARSSSVDARSQSQQSSFETGWPISNQERGDFYHRIRVSPRVVADWRKRFIQSVLASPGLFPLVPEGSSPVSIRPTVDLGISYLREITRLLSILHGNPGLGNKEDPVDELVYIILSRKTRENAYQDSFDRLKKAFRSWDALLDAPHSRVRRLIYSGGLSGKKTDTLYRVLNTLRTTFGSCTLDPARSWSDEKLEDFLCALPEIQKKSAYCVMMYSMGRQVFPVDTHVGRVLTRLGPYRELGLDLIPFDHRKKQLVLKDMIPPNLRWSLHVNLVEHGRKVCRSQKPKCEECQIRKFCHHHRTLRAKEQLSSDAPTVIDLFSGAGGLSEGARRAGFRTLLAIDSDPIAARTFRLNHPELRDEKVMVRDIRNVKVSEIRKLIGRKTPDVLVGSPPCQGFSLTGKRSKPGVASEFHSAARRQKTTKAKNTYQVKEDERNYLYDYMIDLALALRPRLFLLENVPGMSSARRNKRSFLDDARNKIEANGTYRTSIWKLNASAYGVPQHRVRLFLVASRLRSFPPIPEPEYQDILFTGFDLDALPPVSFGEATFDLPERSSASGRTVDVRDPEASQTDPRMRRYLKKFRIRTPSKFLYNHRARYHNDRDLELYALLQPGENSVHAVEKHGRRDLMRYRQDVFDDKYARLRSDRPSKTIVAHLAKDGNGYVHPEQVRSITVREAARVQSFDDDYVFCGSPSDQWVQVGNSVPPLLAEVIFRSFKDVLGRNNR